jgi:hypothetical protein
MESIGKGSSILKIKTQMGFVSNSIIEGDIEEGDKEL